MFQTLRSFFAGSRPGPSRMNSMRASLRPFLQRYLSNTDEVLEAWSQAKCPPPLELKSGIVIHHDWPVDPVYLLLYELFIKECYTGKGFYEPNRYDTVIDCGANIGMFAFYLANRAPGIHVHCFEPAAATFERLALNITSNALEDSITAHQFGLWNESCAKLLNFYQCSGRRSLFRDPAQVEHGPDELIVCLDLTSAIKHCKVDKITLLKIDAEGAEPEILEGLECAFWQRIERVVIEYHEQLRPGSSSRLARVLGSNGFSCNFLANPTDPIGIIQSARFNS